MANEKRRLIDANALILAIDEYMKNVYGCPLNEVDEFQMASNDTKVVYMVEGLYEATEIIDDAPTVDAVEVVRCKDCKYGELDEFDRDAYYLCHYHGCGWNDGNHYCSYGERKDDD